ncbi:MAG: hypothetical protein ACRCXN_02725 [Bacteroidales bacterium]
MNRVKFIVCIVCLLFAEGFTAPSFQDRKEGSRNSDTPMTFTITGNEIFTKALNNVIEKIDTLELAQNFINAINERNINFIPATNTDRIVTLKIYKGDHFRFKFIYDYDLFKQLSEKTIELILLHEVYHMYKGNNSENEKDHEEMSKDPLYLEALKIVFPNESDQFYQMAQYAGTVGSPVFEDLPYEKQDELIALFHRYNVTY